MKQLGSKHYLLGALAVASLGTVACGHSHQHSSSLPVASVSMMVAPPVSPSTSASIPTVSHSVATSGPSVADPGTASSSSTIDRSVAPSTTVVSPAPQASSTVVVRSCTSDQITTTYTPVDHDDSDSAASAASTASGAPEANPAATPQSGSEAYLWLMFTNTSQSSCTLQGYPGAAGLDAMGHQIAQARRTPTGGPTPPPTILLAPNTIASATIRGTALPSGADKCGEFASLLVTPPNTTRSVPVTESLASCSFEVYPVTAGPPTDQS